MTTKKKPEEKIDPTLPFTEIEIGEQTYKMCFDHGALAMAEEKLLQAGHEDANLMFRCPPFTFSNIRVLFAVSLIPYQPDTDFEEARKLVTFRNKIQVLGALLKAWELSMPEPEKESDPSEPEQ